MNLLEMTQQRAQRISQMRALLDAVTAEKRDLNSAEDELYVALETQVNQLDKQIAREQALSARETELSQPASRASKPGAPAVLRIGRGDNEQRALAHYIRTGDASGLGEIRASNDTDMNVTTSADGGYAVPTGQYSAIIAKRDAAMLANALGVLRIPGIGLTTNVPVDNGTANVFVSTTEAAAFDRDAPALGQAAMTKVLYSKKIQLSVQLLADEDSRLLDFLNDYVARAMALTHNALLVTEALASGTSVTLAAAAAGTATDVQTMVYSMKGEYADNANWVMKRATEGAYRKLTTTDWAWAPMPTGEGARQTLWNFPVYNSESVPAIGAGLKSSIFGNFQYMGLYEEPALTFLRDPYGDAATGQVNLFYYFRAVYKVLVAEAILYGKHPTA